LGSIVKSMLAIPLQRGRRGGVEAVRDGGWWGESMTTGPRQGYTGKGRDEVY